MSEDIKDISITLKGNTVNISDTKQGIKGVTGVSGIQNVTDVNELIGYIENDMKFLISNLIVIKFL